MGAAESLSLAITTQTTGTAEVEKLVSALNKYIDKVQEAKDKSEKGPNPASWEAFAGHVKDAIQNPLQTAGNAAEGMLKSLGPLGTGLVATAGGMAATGAAALSVARQMGELGLSIQNTSLRMGLTMGDPRQNRQNQLNNELTDWHYFQPQALSSMMDGSGNLVNYDARGNVRSTPYDGWRFDVMQSHYGSSINGQPTPIPGSEQPVYIYAMDAQSFAQFATNNRGAIANSQYQAIQKGHPVVQAIRAATGTA